MRRKRTDWLATPLTASVLFALLQGVASDVHPLGDQILQSSADAKAKGVPGAKGRKACARHVATYTATHLVAAVVVLRALGWRVPLPALLAGHVVTAVSHFLIDRRRGFKWLMSKLGSQDYIALATVVRRFDEEGQAVIEETGPGTALMELDQAAHRFFLIVASLVTALIVASANREVTA